MSSSAVAAQRPAIRPMTTDDFAALRSNMWPQVEAELTSVVPKCTAVVSLEAMTWYHFSTGGKRLRALVPLAVADALGAPMADALPFAAAVEMLHNATLVHDDLQDGDTHRRGLQTVWNKYSSAQAINCGDAMFYYTLQLAQRTPRQPEVVVELERRILRHTLDVIAGQAAEFSVKDAAQPTMADYFRVVRGKTSGLFTLPLVGGAIVAGASPDVVVQLERVGDPLGVLFQVQDDLLDLVGDKGRDERATDIAEGKVSLPAAHFLETAPAGVRDEFRAILERPRVDTTREDIERALDLLDQQGSLAFAAATIRDQHAEVEAICSELENSALAGVIMGLCELFVAPIRPYLQSTAG